MVKIAFHLYHFTVRGSEVCAFDYAYYNKTLLGNTSIIVCPRVQSQPENVDVVLKFKQHFPIIYYDTVDHLNNICTSENINLMYIIKYGTNDGVILYKIPTAVHCVFNMSSPHGSKYVGVSDSVARTCAATHTSVVPHIIHLPEICGDYREYLGIPRSAVVFGRHGGGDTFDIHFVVDAILKCVQMNSQTYFLFATRPHIMRDVNHPQIIYLPEFVDLRVKRKFVNTCDAMIHGCSLGESFGISVLEFSYCNLPVITWTGGRLHRQHIANLGELGIYYSSYDELLSILNKFDPGYHKKIDYTSITDKFTPMAVMSQFNKVFLSQL